MKRIREIIGDVRNQLQNDDFFRDFEESCRIIPGKKYYYGLYNRALTDLDAESWSSLKNKALRHYLNHREGQKKQGFFNQLNEAFAYRYLVGQGFSEVRLIAEEGKKKSPDISFTVNKTRSYCEVKTLGISDNEINRRASGVPFDGVYVSLSDGFLNKFSDAVATASQQIHAWGSSGLIYVIMLFDDIALDYYQNYKKQLIAFSSSHRFENLFIKIGLGGNKRISVNLMLRRSANRASAR